MTKTNVKKSKAGDATLTKMKGEQFLLGLVTPPISSHFHWYRTNRANDKHGVELYAMTRIPQTHPTSKIAAESLITPVVERNKASWLVSAAQTVQTHRATHKRIQEIFTHYVNLSVL